MARFVAMRVLIAAGLLWALSVVTFLVYSWIPADPAGFLLDLRRAKPAEIGAGYLPDTRLAYVSVPSGQSTGIDITIP